MIVEKTMSGFEIPQNFLWVTVEWSTWTYRHTPADRRLNASKILRQLAEVSGISTYRCTHYWLENEIIKKFYRSIKHPSVDKVKNHDTL